MLFRSVGVTAFKMGIVGFLIPYMFVYNPVLLMQGETIPIIVAFITATIGVICIAAGFQGWYLNHLGIGLRAMVIIAGLGLVLPGNASDMISGVVVVAFLLLNKFNIGTKKTASIEG